MTDEEFQKLEVLLNKYFKTLEVQKTEQEEQQKKELEEQEKLLEEQKANDLIKIQEQEQAFTTDLEFRQYVLEKLDTNNLNIQYTNNILYWSIVVTGTILISVLLYKFLKIFY